MPHYISNYYTIDICIIIVNSQDTIQLFLTFYLECIVKKQEFLVKHYSFQWRFKDNIELQ